MSRNSQPTERVVQPWIDAPVEYVEDAEAVPHNPFEDDPTMICLNPMTKQEKLRFFPKFFTGVVTAAAMGKASTDGIDDWESCAVFVPPGKINPSLLTIILYDPGCLPYSGPLASETVR